MFFKNMQIFKFSEPFREPHGTLNAMLEGYVFKPCAISDSKTKGFVSPSDIKDSNLVYSAAGFYFFCIEKEEKIIPPEVIKKELNARIKELEDGYERKLSKGEKANLKDDVYYDLVTRAFSKNTRTYAYIDTAEGYFVVDTPSHTKAEEFAALLRSAIGSFKIELPKTQTMSTLLASWLKSDCPKEFEVNDRCVLLQPQEGSVIRCQRQDLFTEEMQALIHDHRFVAELGLSWKGQVSFNLKSDFSLSQIKFNCTPVDNEDLIDTTQEECFNSNFVLMAGTLRQLTKALISECGDKS